MAFDPIPQPSRDIPRAIAEVLNAMRSILQRSFLGRSNERAVTRADLIKLGLADQSQLNDLED